MDQWLYLAAGGVAGTLLRHTLVTAAYQKFGSAFPYGTLMVNVAGCFLIGFLDVLCAKKLAVAPALRLLFMVGFCGALTTFSAFVLDTNNLMKEGETVRALLNVTGSVALCFMVFRLGVFLGSFIK